MPRCRALALALVLVSCGGAPKPQPAPPPAPAVQAPPPAPVDIDRHGAFPKPDELEALADTPSPPRQVRPVPPALEPVDVVGPLPVRIGATRIGEHDDPFDAIIASAVAGTDGIVWQTEGMNCVARELGHFVGRVGAEPDEPFKRFVAQACGLATANVATLGQWFEGGAKMTPAAAAERFGSTLDTLANQRLFPIDHQVGGWLGRVGDRWTVLLAAAPLPLTLERVDRRPDGQGEVRLTGRLYDEAVRLAVNITYGPHGVAQCAVDPEVELPAFAATCPTEARDDVATVSFGAFAEGRLLGRMVGAVQVWPKKTGPRRFVPLVDGTALPGDPADWGPVLVDAINARRKALDLEAVRYDVAQSAAIAPLVRPFDDAVQVAGAVDTADTIAMGVMAGWQVDGHVLEGGFGAGRLTGPRTVERVLADLLWLPDGRQALFDMRTTRMAVGAGALPGAAGAPPVGVLVGAYCTLEEGWRFDLARRDAEDLLAALTQARRRRGRTAPRRLPLIEQAHQTLSGAELRGERITEALGGLMKTTAEHFGRTSGGAAVRTTNVDGAQFPDQLLEVEPLEVALVVGYGTREAGPWPPRVALMAWPR